MMESLVENIYKSSIFVKLRTVSCTIYELFA